MVTYCCCGLALHYSDKSIQAYVEQEIERLGPTVAIITPAGAWDVPRHYYALHGLQLKDLAQLAYDYHWDRSWRHDEDILALIRRR